MEPIGNILRLPKEKTPAMEAEARKLSLEKLLLLPSTEELEWHLKDAQAGNNTIYIERAERQLVLGRERDELAKARPEGCGCLGLGYLPFPPGHRLAGKVLAYWPNGAEHRCYCACPDGVSLRRDAEEERERRNAEARRKHIEDVWDSLPEEDGSAGIPFRFKDFRFATAPSSAVKDAMVACLEAGEDIYFDSWFLHGPYGSGKTGLAVSYAWESLCRDIHGTILFRSTPQLLTELRATYNKENEGLTETALLEKYQSVELLILDDLGAEQITGSGWVADRLYQIIGGRHAEKRATIFTSNLFLDALAERIGERITWRILEMCGEDHILEVKGPNLRDFRKGG